MSEQELKKRSGSSQRTIKGIIEDILNYTH